MDVIELLKVIFLGVVEGITEWLPISSTGHMILVDEFIQLNMSDNFKEMFFVLIQLGAILAVVILFWNDIFPFTLNKEIDKSKEKFFLWRLSFVDKEKFIMWFKILVASVPAGIVGVLWDDKLNRLFYNFQTVAVMLILFGILFIFIENYNKGKSAQITSIAQINYTAAFIIGMFQLIAAVFPGTSRSGATIVGALLIGISRTTAAEFTFYLAIPAMFGASLLKLLKFGFDFTKTEMSVLLIGMAVAFGVSVLAIKFLMGYIKKHDFKVFGWYRIVLGGIVLAYYWIMV